MLKELTNALRTKKHGSVASSSTRLKSQFDASNKITIKQLQKKQQKLSKPNPELSQERIIQFAPRLEPATVDNSRNFEPK